MGYNPYECIVCGRIEDNGWGNMYKVEEVKERLELRIDLNKFNYDGGYIITHDVCDKCIRKGRRIRIEDPFFKIKRTKQERTDYWENKRRSKKEDTPTISAVKQMPIPSIPSPYSVASIIDSIQTLHKLYK